MFHPNGFVVFLGKHGIIVIHYYSMQVFVIICF